MSENGISLIFGLLFENVVKWKPHNWNPQELRTSKHLQKNCHNPPKQQCPNVEQSAEMPATPPDRAWIKCSCCTFNEDKPFSRGAVVGRTGKTSVVPWFFGVEHGVGSGLVHELRTPVSRLLSLHSQKSNPNPKFLITAEAYFVATSTKNFRFLWFIP